MAKKLLSERLAKYLEYVNTVNVHVCPTTGVNSGAKGRAYEMAVKVYLTPKSCAAGVAKAGRVDHRSHGVSYEIKTGCGEIARIDPETEKMGKIFTGAEYVIYCPVYYPELAVEQQSFVIPADEMYALLQNLGLVRTKASSASYSAGAPVIDRLTIQSFSNSRKKEDALYEELANFPTLQEWVEEVA